VTASTTFAQGLINFQNSSTTLISAGGVAMPGSSTSPFNFAVFLAPSDTVNVDNTAAPSLTAAGWQQPNAGTVNHATAAGRLAVTAAMPVSGWAGGSTVDYIVRGWSANAGATWAEALAFWNNGNPSQNMYIGSSEIGNNAVLGDGSSIANPTMFGVAGTQVNGFNMALVSVPEPTSMVLAGLGAASLLLFRRRK